MREGVTNVIRHSGATACAVELHVGDDLVLEIRDDGGGPGQGRARGNGLAGLRERVTALDGTLAADRLPGGGFLLRVTVPRGEDKT
ncbi:sensor histidine kinase [Sphaerimonospora sp. CA-214678]|uniref:sensor histidine kinase n=1 Tax=Sphaerimonospora sp. CA-214678 TaxID=3240029 RepID=UPI003D907589